MPLVLFWNLPAGHSQQHHTQTPRAFIESMRSTLACHKLLHMMQLALKTVCYLELHTPLQWQGARCICTLSRTWEEVCEVLEDGVLDDVAVNGSHAVHSVAGSNSQVRHAHKPAKNMG
jgi:hypothetical protein